MKVRFFFDVFPWTKPSDVFPTTTPTHTLDGSTRYAIEVEVPEFDHKIDFTVRPPVRQVKEVES